MEFIKGELQKETMEISTILSGSYKGKSLKINGMIHSMRDMGDLVFLLLRKREGLFQCVYEKGTTCFDSINLKEAASVEVEGFIKEEERAPNGLEIHLESIKVLSESREVLPLPVSKWKLNTSLEAKLKYRSISLRNMRERAKFKIQEGIIRGFRDFLYLEGFTEIHTPKIGAKGAEGGSNLFHLDYFHQGAVLAQSPQFYKQMMVGVFDRVFETAPVFRAEKHNTKRHLNEYISLDFEMGYIEGFQDIMEMEVGFLQYMLNLLSREYESELKILEVTLPKADKIPAVCFKEAKEKIEERYQKRFKNPYDLEPEEEVLISQYYKEEYDADFVFVTHYPSKKRPFYTMDDPNYPSTDGSLNDSTNDSTDDSMNDSMNGSKNDSVTLSFDLLFHGIEITTGGQRIHDYKMLMEKLEERGMETEGMDFYLDTFKYGMPPHGGLGIGLERLTMKLLNEDNIRETALFPRDLSRLEP